MASFKSNPIFFTSLLLIGAVTAGEAWLIYSQRAEAKRVATEIQRKEQTLQNFAVANPFPSRENSDAVDADRQRAEQTLAAIRKELQSTGELAQKLAAVNAPQTSTDAFFDLAKFVERLRDVALNAKVGVPANTRFGFATYASTGPSRELIGQVFRQRQYVEYLVETLVKANPREIRAVERARPLLVQASVNNTQGLVPAPASAAPGEVASDFFVIDPQTSATVPGFVDTEAFRLSFTGTTDVLRTFLNELALFKLPIVVRSVEVEPLDKTALSAASRPAPAPPANTLATLFGQDAALAPATPVEEVKPLVEQIDSIFVVTVEVIKFVDKSGLAVTTP